MTKNVMSDGWLHLPVNPDPWAIGPLYVGKSNGRYVPRVGRNAQMAAYKETVAECLQGVEKLPSGFYKLTFYFWRRLDKHASGRKHLADATNLQKATEDALQGVLIDNDRDVRDVRSIVVEQSEDTDPHVVIHAEEWFGFDMLTLPREVYEELQKPTVQTSNDNTWM